MTTEDALQIIFGNSDPREQRKADRRHKRTSLQRTFLTILENRYCHPVRDWSIYDIAKAEKLSFDSAKRRYNRHLERLQEIFVSRQQAISGGVRDCGEVPQRQRPLKIHHGNRGNRPADTERGWRRSPIRDNSAASVPPQAFPCLRGQRQNKKGKTKMKLNIDWNELAKAVIKAVWPFIAGAVGGLFAGCTVGGIGPNFFA